MANAFAFAKQNGNTPAFTRALADAINRGGANAQFAYSESMARAYASGGDSRAGVIEATAWALCQGNYITDAWTGALSVALYNHQQLCDMVTQANVLSAAQCATTLSVTSNTGGLVFGYCGV
jgi:hypothetical protein